MSDTIVRIRRLQLPLMIGILDFEREAPQMVEISIDMQVQIGPKPTEEAQDYVSYAPIVEHLKALSTSRRHIDLVEQLADEIFEFLFTDPRITEARIEVMKPEIFAEADAVGVVITRANLIGTDRSDA